MSVEAANAFIRWLRAEYQNPNGEQETQAPLGMQSAPDAGERRAAKGSRKLPWPKTLSERVKAVSTALSSYKEPVTPEALAKRFAWAKSSDVSEILEPLCTVGHAHRGRSERTYLP